MEKLVEVKKAFLTEVNTGLLNSFTISIQTKEEYDLTILKDQIRNNRKFKPLKSKKFYKPKTKNIIVMFASKNGYIIDAFGEFEALVRAKDASGKVIDALHIVTDTVYLDYSFPKAEFVLKENKLYLKLLEGKKREILVLKMHKGNYLIVGKFINEEEQDDGKVYLAIPLVCFFSFHPNKIYHLIHSIFTKENDVDFSFIILLDEISSKIVAQYNKERLLTSIIPILDIQVTEDAKKTEKIVKYFRKQGKCFRYKDPEDFMEKVITYLEK